MTIRIANAVRAAPPRHGLTADVVAVAIVLAAKRYGVPPQRIFDACPMAPRARLLSAAALVAAGLATPTQAVTATREGNRSHVCASYLRQRNITAGDIDPVVRGIEAYISARGAIPAPENIVDTVPTIECIPHVTAADIARQRPAPPIVLRASGGGECSVTDRVIDQLGVCAANTITIASILGVNELLIRRTLAVLAYEGRVISDDGDERGSRYQVWRLVTGSAQ